MITTIKRFLSRHEIAFLREERERLTAAIHRARESKRRTSDLEALQRRVTLRLMELGA